MNDSFQRAEVKVIRTVERLVPCRQHAFSATGKQTAQQNPNGYRHDCPRCAETPRKYEQLED